MKKIVRYAFFVGALLSVWGAGVYAATYVSRATGNWNATGTWAELRTGTITTSTASTTVTGVGTLFLTELANGNALYTASGVLIGTVASRATNTSLTLTANAASTNSGIPYYRGATATPGASDDVTVSAGHTVSLNGADRDSRNFTIAATGLLNDTSNALTINNNGAVAINGTWSGAGGGQITKNGTGTLSGSGSLTGNTRIDINGNTTVLAGTNLTFTDVANGRIDIGAGIVVTNNGTVTLARLTEDDTASTWTNAANATLNVRVDIFPGGGVLNASAGGNTVNYSGAAQTVDLPTGSPATYYNLILSGSGAKTLPATAMTIANDFTISGTASVTVAQALTVGRNFTIGSGTTFTAKTFSHSVAGDFLNSGTFTANSSTITFTGGSAQALGGTAATTFNNLTINKSSNNVAIACGTPSPQVNVTLALTSGKVITSGVSPGCSTACASQVPIIVANAGTITGGSSSSYVQGALRKNFAANTTLNFRAAGQDEFPIGDATNYTPIEITAGGTSTAGNVIACVTPIEHPMVTTPPVATGGINAAKSVNRYWSLSTTTINTASGTGAALVDATFKFVAGDVDSLPIPANPANFVVEDWDGTKWNPTTLFTASATSTRAQNIDLSSATNDIAIGEPLSGFTALPGNFNAFDTTTPAGAVLGMIQTKQAGVAFSVRLVRLNTARNALDTTYNQAGVTVELLDSSDNISFPLSVATACRPIGAVAGQWHLIPGTTQTVTFAAGVVNATFSVAMLANVFRDVRVHVVKTGTGAGEGCSTDRFAIRPQSVTISAHDATWETAGTTRSLANTGATGGTVHKASTPAAATPRLFTLRATPVPAGATNYDGSASLVSGFPNCTVLGALCTTPGALSFTAGSWTSAGSGVRENATAHYSEAGSFNLQLEDTGYASVDATDGTPAATLTVPATATVQVGRFVPDHFDVTTLVAPVFRTFNVTNAACSAGGRTFTYIGQPFGYATKPQATVTARNASGNTTINYRGTLWKIGGVGATSKNCTTAPDTNTCVYATTFGVTGGTVTETYTYSLAPVSTPGWDNGAAAPATASVASNSDGTGTITYASSDLLAFLRSTTTPLLKFAATINNVLRVTDNAEGAGQIITTAASVAFNAIGFDAGNEFRYGRLRLQNANGSQLIALPIPMEVQYWSGNGFVTNIADNCTTITTPNNIAIGNAQSAGFTAALVSPPVVGGAFVAGIGSLRLPAPSVAVRGSVDVSVNLTGGTAGASCTAGMPASTASGLTWLQGLWCSTPGTYTSDPTARATFGTYRNTDQFIYQRENF